MSTSVNAPEISLTLEKLAGSMLDCNSASLQSNELAAKASIAKAVSSTIRALGEPLFITGDPFAIGLARSDRAAALNEIHIASYARGLKNR